MTRRRTEGDETWFRLSTWAKGQKASERLSAHILRVEGYIAVDPSHPLGGPDGLKDTISMKDGFQWIGATYFPREQKPFKEITKKFEDDLVGVKENGVNGIAFITNQELTLSERAKLDKAAGNAKLDLFHLERVAGILDSPACYGIRLEFLDIEMTKEEQLAFIAFRDKIIEGLHCALERILTKLETSATLSNTTLEEIKQFKKILDSIAGYDPFAELYVRSFLGRGGHITDLKVPLQELKEFEAILKRIVRIEGSFEDLSNFGPMRKPTVQDIKIPIHEIIDCEKTIDRVIEKLKEAKRLKEELNDA